MPLSWDMSDVFLMSCTGGYGFGGGRSQRLSAELNAELGHFGVFLGGGGGVLLHLAVCGDLISPTRDGTHAPCNGSMES